MSYLEPEHRTITRCFSSPWAEAVLITQGVTGDLIPPASWGWVFFLNAPRKGLAEPSCRGSGYEEGWAMLWRWLTLAL